MQTENPTLSDLFIREQVGLCLLLVFTVPLLIINYQQKCNDSSTQATPWQDKSALSNSPLRFINYLIKTQRNYFSTGYFFFLNKMWKGKLMSCRRVNTRYWVLLFRCVQLVHKKENHKPLPVRIPLLLYNHRYLLALPNGHNLSNVLITQTIHTDFISNLYLSTGSQHFLLSKF